jgi:hypothetical protein
MNKKIRNNYYCEFCEYKTQNKSKIHNHHIFPKEISLNNHPDNLILVCPTCHTNIFCKESKSGHHSIYTIDSIEVVGKFTTTGGKIIIYKQNNKEIIQKIKN